MSVNDQKKLTASDVKRAASAIVDVTDEFPVPVALRALMVVAAAMNRENTKSPLPTFDELASVLKEVIEERDREARSWLEKR